MNEKNKMTPTGKIELYEKASLANAIKALKEHLVIQHFQLVPQKPFSIKKYLSNPNQIIKIKDLLLPEINRFNFKPYVSDYLLDMNERITNFRNNSEVDKEEKIKTLTFLIAECTASELEYYPYNQELVLFNFDWIIDKFPIRYSRIALNHRDFDNAKAEIILRFEFFQLIKSKLELLKIQLEAEKPISKYLKWNNTKRPQLNITEIILALEESNSISFFSDQSKSEFRAEICRVFNVKPFKWSEMISEIKKREGPKFKFLKSLSRENK